MKESMERRGATRLDASVRARTVVDVLTGVYHRCLADDLRMAIEEAPEKFGITETEWRISRVWVDMCRVERVESLFFQPLSDFSVDLYVRASVRVQLACEGRMVYKGIRSTLRLRYAFDLRPCRQKCRFVKAVLDEKDALAAQNPSAIRMDKYLLPVLRETDYPYLAKWILARYDLAKENAPLDAEALAERMGLKRLCGKFVEDDVMGEIYFNYGHATMIDPDTGDVRDVEVGPCTILLNETACASRGAYNVTLLHECAHHLLATKHFLLQMMGGPSLCSYLCRKKSRERRQTGDGLSPVDIMEIQANKLPGYLQIEEKSGRAKAAALLTSYSGRSLEKMSRLIRDMSELYATTQTVVRTRLQTLGFREVCGIFQAANGRFVPAYVSDLRDGQTYTIDHSDALREYATNEVFREILDSGEYVYAEGHFCRNAPRYVRADRAGDMRLSAYAREHMAECCLTFEVLYGNGRSWQGGVLQKGRIGKREVRYVGRDGKSPVTAEGETFRKRIADEYRVTAMLRMSFNDMLVRLMDVKKVTIARLAEDTGLSDETIKNMRNDPKRHFSIESIVAICIALHLSPDISRQLIESSPAKFMSSEEMSAYRYVLLHCYQQEVSRVNRFLVEAGYRPLTRLVDGYGEDGVRLENEI